MDDRSLRVLEFYNLLDFMKEFSVSPLGRKRSENLRPTNDLFLIQSRLSEVIELKEIIETSGEVPLRGLRDIEEILKKLDIEGSVLDVKELLEIYNQIQLCKGIKKFFLKIDPKKVVHLWQKISSFSYLKSLERDILWAINQKGEILDRASPKLSELREQLRRIRERINCVLERLLSNKDLEPIFQDHFITMRNGRYVLPIKSDYKNRFEGIIHDQSQSGMTLFIEPIEVVGLNNEINILSIEEKAEEYRILKDLSEKVRREKDKLWSDLLILGELDLLYAMAKLSIILQGVKPTIQENGKIDIIGARNPILMLQKGKEVVPIDLRIGDGKKVLIISGANAGGKTVALKTFGLLCLMVQSGLPIPVEDGSQVTIFDKIYAVIGDDQNIEENLSTFTSHLLQVDEILEKSDERSLVLLDELGMGTNAQEGCALAMAFLDQFREKKALVAVTTHFDPLKIYGYLHSDVDNVAVEFDEETLEPKYRLLYGFSGVSKAFLVAEKLGISKKVLELSRYYTEGSDQGISKALETLESLKRNIQFERDELIRIKQELVLERDKLRETIDGIKKKRQEILLKMEEKSKRILKQLEEEIKKWWDAKKDEIVNSKEKFKSLRSYRKEIKEIKEKVFPYVRQKQDLKFVDGLKIGENVKIEPIQKSGILTKIDQASEKVEVLTDRITIKAPLSQVVKIPTIEEEKKSMDITKNFFPNHKPTKFESFELNVRGLTIEDALPEIDKFIDNALLKGIEKVYVIHGIGSGRLKKAISNFLKEHPGVKQFGPADQKRGGLGVTVVELR